MLLYNEKIVYKQITNTDVVERFDEMLQYSSHTKNKSGEREKKNGKVTSYYYKRRINICTRGVA